jgi:hypothetical protein
VKYPQTIWKYPIPIQDHIEIEMPKTAKLLRFAEQSGGLFLWVMVPVGDSEMVKRKLCLAGTGHTLDDYPAAYVGTVLLEGGRLVFHLFDFMY